MPTTPDKPHITQNTTVTAEMGQVIYQPGDGTKYRLNFCPVPHEHDEGQSYRQYLLTMSTGGKGHSMFVSLPIGESKGVISDFYLHPSYVEEKFGVGTAYLSRMTSHLANMLFSPSYHHVLQNMLDHGGGTEGSHARLSLLPRIFANEEAIKAELAKLSK